MARHHSIVDVMMFRLLLLYCSCVLATLRVVGGESVIEISFPESDIQVFHMIVYNNSRIVSLTDDTDSSG